MNFTTRLNELKNQKSQLIYLVKESHEDMVQSDDMWEALDIAVGIEETQREIKELDSHIADYTWLIANA